MRQLAHALRMKNAHTDLPNTIRFYRLLMTINFTKSIFRTKRSDSFSGYDCDNRFSIKIFNIDFSVQ